MKNFLLLLTFVLVAALPGKVNAQCACAGTDYASINVAGWTVGQSGTITTVQYAGERATIQNTVAGATYRVASCGASYDSQLTIYTTGCGYVAYNDDNGPACTGNKASVDFVSPGGNLYSKLNVFNCGTNSTSTTVTITLLSLPCTVQGNPATYPTGQWNAYVWNAGNANGDAGAWTNNYSGYYVISATSFDTRQGQTLSTPQSWGENNSPSNASGYLGCAVGIDNHSYAFRRTGLGADGWWRLTIPTHDDESRLFVNGGQVWQHDNACCDLHTNAYTGWITSGTTLDYRVSEGGGGSHGSMDWCLMAGDNSYGTYPTWNAYVYDNQSINDNDYQGWFTETGSGTTLISDNFGTGQPGMIGARCGKTMDNDYYNVRYKTVKSFSNGIYVFTGTNDDGRRLSINGGASWLFDNWGSGAGTTVSSPTQLNGSYSMVYDMYEQTGGASASLTECLMGGGDLSGYGSGSWAAYAYNTANYNFFLQDYRGTFSTGSANSTSASFSLSDATVASLRTGACGTAISADPSVRTRVSQTFLKGIYTLSAGSDDFFRLSISGGSSWDIQSNNTTINVSRAIPGGSATNVVYEGYDTGGPGAFAGSVTAQAPVAGSLAANTTCGSATLTWTGGNGYYVWESSTDGSNYTTLVGETNTIASPTSAQNVNPGVQTWYRVRSESGGSVVYSNVIIVSPIPSNDNCASATNITTLPFTGAIVSNACATNDGPASTCDGPYKNIWWRYTATACGVITARTCTGNTNYDNEIAVFSGSCSGTEVICNDDNGAGCTSSYAGVTFNAVAGTTYYIAVGSYNSVSSTGNNQLEVTFSSPALLAGSFTNTTQTICSGGDPSEIGLTSNVGASGGVGTLTYTWQYQVNCTGGWTNIIGANSATYDPPAGLTQTRCYRRVVTDACNNTTATTNFGTVTVVPGPTWATNSVTPTAFCVGSTVSLSATVNNGSGSTITWVRATSPGGAGTTVTTGDNPGVGTFYYRPTYTSSANGCSLADGTETTVTISADPIAPTLASATPASGTSICLNVPIAPANVTFNTFGTSGMGGCADEYQYTINGGTNYFPYTPGVTVITPNTPGTNMVRIQSRRVCGGLTCDGSAETYATIAQWSVYPDLPAPTINGLALDTLTACGIVNIIPDVNSYSFSYYTSVPPAVAVGTGPSIAASSGGTYYVTTYNTSTGCNSLGYATAVLISTASFSFSMTTTPVSCFNGSNGTAQATLDTVGTAPYTFTWSGGTGGGGNFGVNRTGLSAGNYTLLVADAAGCQTQANFQILQPSAPVAFAAPSVSASTVGGYNINCNGGTGSITNVNVSGGNGGYSYAWTPNVSTTQSASGLTAGTYNVSVTDNKGCNASTSITLTQPNPVTYTVGIGYNCSGSTYGSATIYVNAAGGEQSGALPYNYRFNGGSYSTLNEFVQGSNALVNFTVRDGNGCTINGTATPTQVGQPVTATDACNAIYVSIGGSAAESGTKTCPTSLEHAVSLLSPSRNKIIMQGGTYSLTIDQTLVLPSAVSNIMIDGGYTITNPGLPTAIWTKKSNTPSIFTIDPPEASGGTNIGHKIGINATNCTGLVLSDLRFTVTGITSVTKANGGSITAATGYGKSVYGIYLNNCSNYEITRCKITTGPASAGSNGTAGSNGGGGNAGAGGGSGDGDNEGLCYGAAAGGAGANNGGAGGLNACGSRGSGTGSTGDGGGGTGGGGGGNGCNEFGCTNPGVGGNGNAGAAGSTGAVGSAGAAFSQATYFVPGGQAGTGATGTAGRGGGGGGGGGREEGTICNDGSGGGGGGGGGGGYPGTGGTGGFGGGSSYGIYLWNNPVTNSGIINDYDITVGAAGAGGTGGNGGTGGSGGAGGAGGDNGCNVGAGGNGGNGGAGGAGGNGGNGASGEAVAIKLGSGTSPSISGASIPSGADGVAGVTVDQDQGCTNSVITIGKGVNGTWTLPTGATIVNDLNSTTPSTSVSTNTALIQYTAIPSAPNPQDLVANGVSYKNYVNIRYDRALPTMNISNVAPCANVPITLTCTSNGGNPSGNPIEYEWKIITGTTANNPSSGVVNAINTTHTFTATGTYQVRLRVKVSCCGWSAPIYTTINVVGAPAAPTVPSGLATLCELTTGVAYTTNNVVGNTYNWSVVGGTIATGAGTNAPTVDWGAYTGTANIRVSATNSCGTSGFSPTLTVNLRRKPTAVAVPSTIPPNFCGNTGNLVISGSATQNSPGGNNTFTYLWSPGGQVTQNINVTNSTLTQSYTVVATEGVSGCQSLPATVNVVVNPSPVAPTFTDGATTLCANAVDTFAATTTQGTITYSIVGGTGASINATTGILSSAGTTNFSVRATSTAAPCGTAVTDRAVTVIPTTAAPTFTSGPISICPNATPTYVATTTGGTITYSIIGGNGAAINATTGALTSTGTANFTVRATATGTCSGPFFTDRAVTVQPGTVPATYTSGPTSICANSTATYVFSTTLGTITYSIVGGSGAAINPTTGVLTSSGTADFAVRATTTGTCGGPYISDFAVTVIPSAAAPVFTSGPTSICANNDGNYNATSISGVISYSVVGGTGAAIDPTSGYLSSAGTTNFIVRATATTPSCGSTSTDRAVTVLTTPDLVIVDPPTVCTPATVNITAPGVVTDANGTVGTLAYFANSTDANNNVNPLPNPTAISVPGFYYVTKTTTVGGCVDIDAIYADISLLPNLVVTNPPSVCSPGTVNLTAPSVVNDINGTVGTYSYFPTMADAVANTNPLANPISIASPGTYYIKKTTDAGGCTDIEPVVVTIVSCGPITWVGGTPGFQTNWDKPTNWTPNGPPTAVDVIIIPNVTYDPIISVDNGEAKDVTIAAGATIGINSGFILDIKGNWNGTTTTIVSGPGKTIFSGNAPQTITGGGTFSTLQINNASGVTIAAGANVVRATTALELKAGNLTTNGNLLTASTALHTTYIDDFSAGYTGTVTGNVRVERYITSGPNGFRYIGAPVATTAGGSTLNLGALSGFVISGTPGQLLPVPTCNPNSSAMNSPYGTFMRWEEAGPFTYNCRQAGWWFQTTGTMTIGRGYGAKLSGGNKITYTGAANTGAKSYGPLANSGPIGNGWHLVSNPYPSSMAISNVDANPNNNMPAGFDGQIQLYLTSGPYTGSYLAYNTGIAAAPFSLGQGFWVRTPSSGTFSLTNSYRVTNQVTYYDVNSDIQHHLKVDVAGNGYMDKTDIYFLPTAQTGLDFYDAEKWAGRSEQPTLYTSVGTQMTAINSLPSLQETVVVPMGVKPGTNGDFTFTFDDIATFPQTSMIYLEDLQLGTMNDLRANNTYNFTANVNDNADRFMLHFQPGLQAEVADQDCDNAGSIELTQPAPTVWSTYEVRGNDNNVYAQGTNFTGSVSVTNLPPQEYVVSVTHASGYTAQEFITVNGNSQVDATINASATNIMVDEMVSLTGVAADANEYVWNFGDGNTQSGSSSVVHAYDAEGIYTVSMTASNSTCNDVATKVINVSKSTTGIDGIDANNIKIYGQGEHVIIEFNNWGGNKADIFMYNALGQRMESLTGVSTLKGRQELYIADIVPGTYFIQVVSDGKIQGKKVFLGKQ